MILWIFAGIGVIVAIIGLFALAMAGQVNKEQERFERPHPDRGDEA